MKCWLMNKNTKVCEVEFDGEHNEITKVYEMYHIEYAPLCVFHALKDKSTSIQKSLNAWFKGRGIPSWRKDLEGF